MDLSKACIQVLCQLKELVEQIKEEDFTKPSAALSQSTIGQHLRHTLEFFLCFEKGFYQGIINYDNRAHDKQIESNKYVALNAINTVIAFVENTLFNAKSLKLEVNYNLHSNEFMTVETNAARELVYNIEHAVHHMAIIKIGVAELVPYIKLPSNFGVAASTIRHHEVILQS